MLSGSAFALFRETIRIIGTVMICQESGSIANRLRRKFGSF
jgi:hypothetical protein